MSVLLHGALITGLYPLNGGGGVSDSRLDVRKGWGGHSDAYYVQHGGWGV